MALKKPYHIHRQMHLGDFLDELAAQGSLEWTWEYDQENHKALFHITEPGKQRKRYFIKSAEDIASRLAYQKGIAWLPVPHPGNEDRYQQTQEKIAALRSAGTLPPAAQGSKERSPFIERVGIVAKYSGVCPICGSQTVPGDRLFKLPADRRSARNPWVCAGCRYPENRTEPTLEDVFIKLNHRNNTGRTPGLNRHDVAHLLSLHDKLAPETAADLRDMPGSIKLWNAYTENVSANLSRAELLDLLEEFVRPGLIRRVGRNRYLPVVSFPDDQDIPGR
ncbi:hypothetical protein AB4Z38_09985 [Arthrobacter sp. 2RAF6]|uniref:hypothetical protein n=1 Tax=Arthrobacter sp. 2RAF6 TaxID=3233002 RepID=UPI003F92964D